MRCVNLKSFLGLSVAGIGVFAFVGMCYAASGSGRGAYNNLVGATAARMPTMPTLPGMSIGNTTQNIPSGTTTPDVPDEPIEPGEPDVPDTPVTECPDGGVKNSTYTVENCMDDVLRCVNSGALPGGLNDLFNADLRHAIENGMGVCTVQVDKCVTDVRRDCRNVYRSGADVWIDFNSRRVQPAYYSFVLRKTGLTPNQAENTCRLLDKNTYGASFTAVSNLGNVTSEYNNRVGAYNEQRDGTLSKAQTMGVDVNDGNPGVDGARGHYARWDASTATCLVRVAAYNKDKQIKNSWLFGAVGNDKPAEIWKEVGETFTCNKDLFGFSLMNDTNTAAVVGIGGGTLLGAGIGAAAGHGAEKFDCANQKHRDLLMDELNKIRGGINLLNKFMDDQKISTSELREKQCENIVDVYRKLDVPLDSNGLKITEQVRIKIEVEGGDSGIAEQDVAAVANALTNASRNEEELLEQYKLSEVVFNESVKSLLDDGVKGNRGVATAIGAASGAAAGGLATAITAFVEKNNISCRVGDGLEVVAYGKSYSIGNLRDFYVKWDLRLPDTVAPTAHVTDCQSWQEMCATYTDTKLCETAQFNYKPAGAPTIKSIPSACVMSGSVCIENYPVAKSYGACK